MSEQVHIPEGEITNENLLAAVKQLTAAVRMLNATMKEDYPKRAEVKRNRRTFIWAVMVGLLLSYFANVSTVNYCFLQGIPDAGTHQFCRVFPGWDDSFNNNRDSMQTVVDMQKIMEQNQKEIAQLKAKVK